MCFFPAGKRQTPGPLNRGVAMAEWVRQWIGDREVSSSNPFRAVICSPLLLFNLVSSLVLWAESTTKDYITAKNNVQSVSYLLCTQVIKPQVIQKPQNKSGHKFTWKTYTNIKNKIFEELVPLVSPLLKKHIRLGQAGIVDHSVDLSIPDFFF